MAAAQGKHDFRLVLDEVRGDLLDYMDLVPVLEELKESEVFRFSTLRDLQEKHSTTSEKISALLQLVKDGGYTKYVQFKQCLGSSGQEPLVEKLDAAERGEYKRVVRKKSRTGEEELLEVLKEDLIVYYRERESTTSVAPLVEQHDAELTKFYVRPPMMAYNKPNAFGQKKQSEENSKEKMSKEKTSIRSYRELLLKDSDPYKRIYVTADAGMGKTSFAKMLAVTWCEAHASKDQSFKIKSEMSCADEMRVKKIGSDAYSFYTEDVNTMEKFDFLFLIKLREYEDSNKCRLDEMIFETLIPKLQHKCRYTGEFLENVLCNKRCLIIVDGLDEWIHPQSCRSGEVIPHRKQWPGCTVLTTTRPWKLSSAHLSKADIDRQVEITQLDETTARELKFRALEILNENQRQNGQVAANSKTKTVTDFENSVPKTIHGHILHIPFVLLQMICLWFGGNPIGKSLCEVYSNIIELTLTRWLVKTDSGHTDCKCEPSKEHENIKLKCMENNRHCQCYMPLLLKIGQLVFLTLFKVVREESLLFGKEQVLKYLSEAELKQCLDMGLLSQVKNTASLTKVRLQLYFPHKTLHEFSCALFIATHWNNAKTGTISIKQTISNKCTSVSDIVEMSQVCVFVCGLNPEVYSDISRHLAIIVSTDQNVIDYRNCVEEDSCLLVDYQSMQISCFLECTRNQHPEIQCKIVIEDMFLSGRTKEDEQQVLVTMLSNSVCSLKSLYISLYDEIKDSSSAGEIVRILEQTEFSCLERLDAYTCGPTLLQSALTSAAHTLKYLKLQEVSLTDDVWSAISTLTNVRSLYLSCVKVSRGSLLVLTLPLLTKFTLSQCDLKDSTVTLTLPQLTKFTLCHCDLRDSTVTRTLPQLTKFTLLRCVLGDRTVTLTPEMTTLKTIMLGETIVNIPCYRELFLSISKLPQPITVKLRGIDMTVGEWRELLLEIIGKLPKAIHVKMQWCRGPSGEEWRNIFDVMKATPAFCVTMTDYNVSYITWEREADITFDTVVV